MNVLLPSTIDRPFGCPPDVPRRPKRIVHVLDMPCPPSVNRIWRNNGKRSIVSLAPAYKKWMREADALLLLTGAFRGKKTIEGEFVALIEIRRPTADSDLDNRIKALLDYAQSREFIANDRHLVEVLARWSTSIAQGARLTLRSLPE